MIWFPINSNAHIFFLLITAFKIMILYYYSDQGTIYSSSMPAIKFNIIVVCE